MAGGNIHAIVPYNIARVLEPTPPYPGLRGPKRKQSLQG